MKKGKLGFINPCFMNVYQKNSYEFQLVRFFLGPKNNTIEGLPVP
jgi:hypothetical protein